MAGWAVKLPARRSGKILKTAAEMMGYVPEQLDVRQGKVFLKRIRKNRLPCRRPDLFCENALIGRGSYTPPKPGGTFKGAAVGTSLHIGNTDAEVEIDEETGEMRP